MNLVLIELQRSYLLTIRYPANFIVQMLMLMSLFYLLLMGNSYFSDGAMASKTTETLIVNYFLWTMVVLTMAAVPRSIEDDARAGTLEQVLQCVYPPSVFFLIRGLTTTFVEVVTSVITLGLIILTTGVTPEFDLRFLGVFALVLTCALGLSLMLGGVGVRTKKTSMIINAIQLPLLFLLMFPFEKNVTATVVDYLIFIPFVGEAINARNILNGVETTFYIQIVSALTSVFWVLVGSMVFSLMLKKTKKDGKTSGY